MKSSRGLLQKKEREAKLKNIMSTSSSSLLSSSSSSSTRNQDKSTNSINPRSTTVNRVSSSVASSPRQQQRQQPKKYEDEYEEEHEEHFRHQDEDDLEHDDFDDLSEDERPVIKKVEKVERVERVVESKSKPSAKQAPVKKNSVSQHHVEDEEEHEEDDRHQDYEEEKDEEETNRKKRSIAIVSKSVLSRIIHDAGVDGVSSDVYTFMIMEMQNYIREVIKVVSEGSEDDELVIRESDLKFLGDKSKAPGSLDVKSFERLYAGVADSLNTNAEFSSGAFKAFCAHTEIQMIKFLRKAKDLITCYNKKRLGAKDLECLKKMLDDSE